MSNAFASHFERIGMTADEARSRAALFQELEDRGGGHEVACFNCGGA